MSAYWCCCQDGCQNDCLDGCDTTDGCCFGQDTLVLWNKRPSYSVSQHYLDGDCEVCWTRTQNQLPPVQSIYKYYDCFYRVEYCAGGPVGCITMPTGDGQFCGEGCANPVCNPAYGSGCTTCADVCCGTQIPTFPNNCLYNTWFGAGVGGLSNWRRDTLHADCRTRWFIETTGHKNGQAISCINDNLYNTHVFNIFHERWWKIAQDTCAPEVWTYVPGCNTNDCGGIPFQRDDLVPKWWINSCSGVPVYQWELDEAVELGVIESDEYEAIMAAVAQGAQPPQPAIKKFAKAYCQTKDWRAEQRAAYIDLHTRFPNAGYDACIEDCADMPLLGPVRKRLTASNVTDNNFTPCLHRNDVIPELISKQVPATCFKNYQGDPNNNKDYQFWRQRQWVYFSAIPGGWIWAGWNANCDPNLSEVENILNGCSRGEGIGGPSLFTAPMLAFEGQPRPPATCVPCSCVCNTSVCCNDCTQNCELICGPAPIAACNPPSVCKRFIINPTCEGVRFVASQYYFKNDVDPSTCTNIGEYVCLWSVESFLTTAQRSKDSWTAGCPYTCRSENPPLGAYYTWEKVDFGTLGVDPICDDIILQGGQYTTSDLCCGNYCIDYDYNNCANYPCVVQGVHNDCPAVNECPPHNTQAQDICIGHDIDCP